MGITRACTKWNTLVTDIRDLPRKINEAFLIATSGRPGPVQRVSLRWSHLRPGSTSQRACPPPGAPPGTRHRWEPSCTESKPGRGCGCGVGGFGHGSLVGHSCCAGFRAMRGPGARGEQMWQLWGKAHLGGEPRAERLASQDDVVEVLPGAGRVAVVPRPRPSATPLPLSPSPPEGPRALRRRHDFVPQWRQCTSASALPVFERRPLRLSARLCRRHCAIPARSGAGPPGQTCTPCPR